MKPYSYYTTLATEYPSKANYTVIYYYKRGKLILVKKPFSQIDEVPNGAVEEVVFDREGYLAHEQTYLKEKVSLEEEFKEDLFREEGLTNSEKAEKCFSLAWNYGCSGGLPEVHDYFRELVELIG
jgi:hypothetical protein